jgi:acyl-coenzyme A synthetase/AMP-(fatty) acid ligase/acyl-CoA thioesterase FadM
VEGWNVEVNGRRTAQCVGTYVDREAICRAGAQWQLGAARVKSSASVASIAFAASIATMTPATRKSSKAAKPPLEASAASGFEASTACLEIAAKAAGTLWWWDAPSQRWRTRDASVAPGAGTKTAMTDTSWTPWHTLLDASEAPYFRWYAGAETNACFNACDRHVLDGRGDEVALTSVPEEITAETPRVNITRRELLGAVATIAARLREDHDLKPFDRVLFHAPTDVTHCVYMLACQRLGAAYSATAVDAAEDVLTSRIEDLQPKLVIAAPKGSATHAGVAIDCASKASDAVAAAKATRAPKLVLAESDHAALREACALSRWAAISDAEAFAEANANGGAAAAAAAAKSPRERTKKSTFPRAAAATPVSSDHPLFVSYTSGSTGKPKGVVHGHGGYVSGVLQSMLTVFNCEPGEGKDGAKGGILTVGSSGWITGQSYVLMGPLLCAARSVLLLGSPVFPSPTRAFETAASEKVAFLKTGSATIRQLMTDSTNAAKLDAIDTSSLKMATFCAEPVSAEVHAYAHQHVTKKFINSYWATEHGSMVFSRDTSVDVSSNVPDAMTWPLPWIKCAIFGEASDVVIAGPYPSLALTVFGDAENCVVDQTCSGRKKPWRGDLKKYAATYWPPGAGGFVQGDVARKHEVAAGSEPRGGGASAAAASGSGSGDARRASKPSIGANGSARTQFRSPGYTFHGRSDEVININGNRVSTEQIERCLWGIEVNGAKVRDACVVGAPDFIKGDSPAAFVAFRSPRSGKHEGSVDSIDVAAFKALAAKAVTAHLGAYACVDHVFVVDDLPKTITNKTSRKTLQLLLAGSDAPDASLARREVLPPIVSMVREWRKTGSVTGAVRLDLRKYWERYTFDDHVVQGRSIVPGAGWLCMLASETESQRVSDVSFMRGVFDSGADVRVTKRRRALQCTVGDEVVLRANVTGGVAAPRTIGPAVFPAAVKRAPLGRAEISGSKRRPPGEAVSRGAKREKTARRDSAVSRAIPEEPPEVVITEEATSEQHYRRCGALRLEYAGAYRAIRAVEWSGHVFRAEVSGTHLAAVLDAGLQVACAAVRASTFIPVAVKEFHINQTPEEWSTEGDFFRCFAHGEILEQHADYLVADLRYERVVRAASSSGAASGFGEEETYEAFAALGRVRFARVEGTKPRFQPEHRRPTFESAAGSRAQTLDPKTSLARLRQLSAEQRVEAVRSVIRSTVSDLMDAEVDFEKTVFENGMHSLNAVELLSRVNEALGTGVTTKLVAADAPMRLFAETVAEHATTYQHPEPGDPNARPFPNVDYDTLDELVRRRLAGKTVGVTPYFFLAKYFAYNWFKKAFQFFRIGGHEFVLRPPRRVDLSVEVSMNRKVEFRDIDMNQHYTVEMIVARSVDGVEQLMARSGLSHVELYYKRNLFAAKIQSTFHKELALGDAYFIKSRITKVAGSLMDIRVAFLDREEVLCFEILWTILIVLDSTERVLLDWENVDLMEGKRLRAGPGAHRVEAPATPKKRPAPATDGEDERAPRARR